jgi:Matrixin
MRLFARSPRSRPRRSNESRRVRLHVEMLETRLVPYVLTGNAWVHPELVTISFVPDGTIIGTGPHGPVTSNLFQAMSTWFSSPSVWQGQMLLAAQSWAEQTNLNFAVVPDNGAPLGAGDYQQGDSAIGDIRVSGYVFNNNFAATAYMPPQENNFSVAGDIQFNTGVAWHIGSTFDLYTVAAHEFGHALGLNESTVNTAVMWPYYTGVDAGLSTDDIAGIRANYSAGAARTGDWYDLYAPNHYWYTAADVTGSINPLTVTGQVNHLDITTPGQVDWYVFAVPLLTTGTMTIQVQSAGLSMLQPVVAAISGGLGLGAASGAGHQGGTTVTLTVHGVHAGQTVYVEVLGADNYPNGTGNYSLTMGFGLLPLPPVPLPNTATPDGNPLQGGGLYGDDGANLTRQELLFIDTVLGTPDNLSAALIVDNADPMAVSAAAENLLDDLRNLYRYWRQFSAQPDVIATLDSDLAALLTNAQTGQSAPFTLPDGIVVVTPPIDAVAATAVASDGTSTATPPPDASTTPQVDWSVWSQLTNTIFADLEATGTVPT